MARLSTVRKPTKCLEAIDELNAARIVYTLAEHMNASPKAKTRMATSLRGIDGEIRFLAKQHAKDATDHGRDMLKQFAIFLRIALGKARQKITAAEVNDVVVSTLFKPITDLEYRLREAATFKKDVWEDNGQLEMYAEAYTSFMQLIDTLERSLYPSAASENLKALRKACADIPLSSRLLIALRKSKAPKPRTPSS